LVCEGGWGGWGGCVVWWWFGGCGWWVGGCWWLWGGGVGGWGGGVGGGFGGGLLFGLGGDKGDHRPGGQGGGGENSGGFLLGARPIKGARGQGIGNLGARRSWGGWVRAGGWDVEWVDLLWGSQKSTARARRGGVGGGEKMGVDNVGGGGWWIGG